MRTVTRGRLIILQVLVLSLLATLLGRLWQLQVRDAGTYRAAANANQVRDIITQPPRGEIVDDRGRPLIDNVSALVVRVDRTALGRLTADEQTLVMHRLARALHTTVLTLTDDIRLCNATTPRPCWNGSPYEPVPVTQIRAGAKATTRALEIQQTLDQYDKVVSVVEEPVRNYPKPAGALASTVLGYLGPISPAELKKLPAAEQLADSNAYVGASGLEASYEKYLHGRPGLRQIAVDAQGNTTGQIKYTPARAGDTLVTNLDAKVQAKLESELALDIRQQRAAGYTADYAAGVVMNVHTGGVVALASSPTYQPDFFDDDPSEKAYNALKHEEGTPLDDKAYGSSAPPGSTFKAITSMGVLWDGAFSTDQSLACSQYFQGRHNFDGEVYGEQSLHQALVVSCDTFFYQIAYNDWKRDQARIAAGEKPIEGVQHIAHEIGIGVGADVDLPGAAPGTIGDRATQKQTWLAERKDYCAGAKRRPKGSYLQQIDAQDCKTGYIWEPGDQENEDTGQGTVTVSPLELATAYSALANGGTVYEPRVGKAILKPNGKLVKRIKPKVRGKLPVSQADLAYIRDALHGVVTESDGTGAGAFAGWPQGKVEIWGKTGTAELTGTNQNGCWFASFAGPNGKPQYVTVIELDKSEQGAAAAAPYVRAMWAAIYGIGQKSIYDDGLPPAKLPNTQLASTRSVRTQQSSKNSTKPSSRSKGSKHATGSGGP